MKQVFFGMALWSMLACSAPAVAQVYQTDGLPSGTDTQQVRALPQVPVAPPARKKPVPKPRPITREVSGGFRLNTDGWSVFAERGAVKTEESGVRADMFHNVQLWTVEFSEHKDPSEYRRSTSSDPSGPSVQTKPLIYGKINNFYALKLGYAYRRMIAGKPEPGTVSIHWVYGGGLSVGLQKPYYITAFAPDANGQITEQTVKYDEKTAPYFLDDQYIIGGASFTNGLSELQIVPGLHGKTGLHFDFASGKRSKIAIETGLSGELYTKKIALMATKDGAPYFFSLYAGIQIGRRYAGKQ